MIATALPGYVFKPILGFPTMQKIRMPLRLKDRRIATGSSVRPVVAQSRCGSNFKANGKNHTLTRCCSMKFKHSRGYDLSKTKGSGQYCKVRSHMLPLAMVRHKHTPQNSLYVGDLRPLQRGCYTSSSGVLDWINTECIWPFTLIFIIKYQVCDTYTRIFFDKVLCHCWVVSYDCCCNYQRLDRCGIKSN